MSAPRKYPQELRERAMRLVAEAQEDPGLSLHRAVLRVGSRVGPRVIKVTSHGGALVARAGL